MTINCKTSALAGAIVLAVSLGAATACSGGGSVGSTSTAYASGYAFGRDAANSSSSAAGMGMSPWIGSGASTLNACIAVSQLGAAGLDQQNAAASGPLPATEAPPQNVNGAVVDQWVAGCVAGYGAG